MMSLAVRMAVVAVLAAALVVGDPTYYTPFCRPQTVTVTVTKVDTIVKEVPVYKTVLQLKENTVTKTSTETRTETIKILKTAAHHGYKTYPYGR